MDVIINMTLKTSVDMEEFEDYDEPGETPSRARILEIVQEDLKSGEFDLLEAMTSAEPEDLTISVTEG